MSISRHTGSRGEPAVRGYSVTHPAGSAVLPIEPGWDQLIHDRSRSLEDRLLEFYQRYSRATYTYEWIRIYMFSALMVTHAFSLSEMALTVALVSLVFWLAPAGKAPGMLEVFSGEVPGFLLLAVPVAYATAVVFLEPFYVAAGFAMYLNRRAELEAWDIEQEFRRAFAH